LRKGSSLPGELIKDAAVMGVHRMEIWYCKEVTP
jgi:hypothetical protein